MKNERDPRINTGLITFPQYLIIFVVLNVIFIGYTILLLNYIRQSSPSITISTLIGVDVLLSCLIVALLFGYARRYIYGRPLGRISAAARQIAGGDFSVRVEPLRKDGKKDEMEVLIEDFNTMTGELASIETLKSDFIANVSHELKSPLSIIQTYTVALRDPNLPLEQRGEYADTILHATKNLSAMVTNILKLNKLENQVIQPIATPYQLGEQLRHCALNFMDQWQSKNIDFEIDVDDVLVKYDESLLELVWNNLISNAIKFTGESGSVTLTSKQENGLIVIRVADSGCGITDKVKAHIFDKFYQGDTAHSTEGNGLGLALAKKVVQILNGEIAVESEPDKGATFIVKLKI